MSNHYQTSFGVFMKADPLPSKKKTTHRICSQVIKECVNSITEFDFANEKTMFCPACGNRIVETTTTEDSVFSLYDALYDKGDNFVEDRNLQMFQYDENVLFSRIVPSKIAIPAYNDEGYHVFCKDGDKFLFNAQDEIDEFKEKHSEAIRAFTDMGFKLEFYWGSMVEYF